MKIDYETSMQDATPESVGIASENIVSFIEGLTQEGLCIHSIILVKDGKVVAEGYAPPYDENSLQRMYSVSKSFVGMAVGLLIEEGKISLDDTLDQYFEEYITTETDLRICKTTIEDLLRMASPYEGTSYQGRLDINWVEFFFFQQK